MKLAFIGMGNMAIAIASGMIEKGLVDKADVLAYAPHYDKLCQNAEIIGFTPCKDRNEMISQSDIIIMACKPYQIESVLDEAKEVLKEKALVSIAAGWGIDRYLPLLDETTRVQYIMPNTPVMVGKGVMLFEEKNTLYPEELDFMKNVFSALGLVEVLPTHLMSVGTALTGCGPAFMDLIIEALGDAGVKYGLPRAKTYAMVSKMMEGSASLQLETGLHPGILKDNVCSPAGTTIRGVDALEHAGIRAAFMDAIDSIMQM